jgi:large subunit ribosomal protein L22
MKANAKLNYIRIAPRKMRLLADLVRGKKVDKAMVLLDFNLKKGGVPIKKLLAQAIANAKDNSDLGKQLDSSLLYISKITVDEGPKLKRWRARARGRAARIHKKTSHITIVLDEIKGKKKKVIRKSAEKEVGKIEKAKKEEKKSKIEEKKKIQTFKPEKKERLRPAKEIKGLKRVFRRKAF